MPILICHIFQSKFLQANCVITIVITEIRLTLCQLVAKIGQIILVDLIIRNRTPGGFEPGMCGETQSVKNMF